MNPDGNWNCIGAVSPFDESQVVPVFSSKASLGLVYQTPDLTAPQALQIGVQVPWTPRFTLQYGVLLANLDSIVGIEGIVDSEWRSIST